MPWLGLARRASSTEYSMQPLWRVSWLFKYSHKGGRLPYVIMAPRRLALLRLASKSMAPLRLAPLRSAPLKGKRSLQGGTRANLPWPFYRYRLSFAASIRRVRVTCFRSPLVTSLLRDFIDILELGSNLGCADWVKNPFEELVSILCLNLPPVTKPVFPSPISQSLLTVNAKKIGAASLLFVPVGTSSVYIVILRTGRGRGKHRGTEGTEREGQGKTCTAQSQVRITKTSGFKKNSGSIKNIRQGTLAV
jgi:hypothetical protein